MPNPANYKDRSKFMEDCMHQVKTIEGEPQEKAVAKCLGMWGNKDKKKKCASDLIREISQRLFKI
jgi:hypothetical protein